MNVSATQTIKLRITDAPALDPIDVFLEDCGPRNGELTIKCYGEAWTAYWGGMGSQNVAQFVLSCSTDYLAGKLSSIEAMVDDYDELYRLVRKKVAELRRGGAVTRAEARRTFDRAKSAPDDFHALDRVMLSCMLGDEWFRCIPAKPNSQYQYLCRIIEAVKEALQGSPQAVTPFSELNAIGRQILAQDNRATDAPMFIVEQLQRDWGYDSNYSDTYAWISHAGGEPEEANERTARRLDLLDEDGRNTGRWQKCFYQDRYEFVTACFTEHGCTEYIRLNGHNLHKPRIYAAGSFRNNEYRDIRNALIAITGGTS